MDASGSVAQPGTDGQQRLGQSQRDQDPPTYTYDRALAHSHRRVAGIGASTLRDGYSPPVSSYCRNNPNCWRR